MIEISFHASPKMLKLYGQSVFIANMVFNYQSGIKGNDVYEMNKSSLNKNETIRNSVRNDTNVNLLKSFVWPAYIAAYFYGNASSIIISKLLS